METLPEALAIGPPGCTLDGIGKPVPDGIGAEGKPLPPPGAPEGIGYGGQGKPPHS